MGADTYTGWLERDTTESERLEYQHGVLKRLLGYLVHPKITASLPPDARVADVATGTGIVPRDLAMTLPGTCQLDGFDISDSQFPSSQELPKNVTLSILDAKSPPPEHLRSHFDVVTIRYLVAALATPDDWELVARNMFQLLKPGGWLQWIEIDVSQARNILRGDVALPMSDAGQEGAEGTRAAAEKFSYFTNALAPIFRRAGFQGVTRDLTSTDRLPELRSAAWHMSERPYQLLWERSEEAKGGEGKSKEYIAERIGKIREEVKSGAVYLRYDIHTYLGQRP